MPKQTEGFPINFSIGGGISAILALGLRRHAVQAVRVSIDAGTFTYGPQISLEDLPYQGCWEQELLMLGQQAAIGIVWPTQLQWPRKLNRERLKVATVRAYFQIGMSLATAKRAGYMIWAITDRNAAGLAEIPRWRLRYIKEYLARKGLHSVKPAYTSAVGLGYVLRQAIVEQIPGVIEVV